MTMREQVRKFIQDEEGLTTVEYAVAGGLIAAAVIAAFVLLGGTVDREIREINTNLN